MGYVSGGGQLTLKGTIVDHNREVGLLVDGAGSNLTLNDGATVRDTLRGQWASFATGVLAQNHGTLTMDDVTVLDTEGPGVLVLSDATATVTHSTIDSNAFVAVGVVGASLEMVQGQIGRTQSDANKGGGMGVYVNHDQDGPATVTIQDSFIEDNLVAGVYVRGDGGSTEVTGSKIEDTAVLKLTETVSIMGHGVYASDVVSGLTLTSNEFEGNEGAHVFLHGSNATLTGNSYVSNGVLDFQQQHCGGPISPVDLSADGLTGLIVVFCPEYDTLIRDWDFCLTLSEAVVIP